MTKKDAPVNLDRAWFKKNTNRNFRIRRPVKGEVEDLIRRQVPSAGYDLLFSNGVYPAPTPDLEWQIIVINIDRETLVRVIALRSKDAPDDLGNIGETGTALAIVLGSRLVIDRKAG